MELPWRTPYPGPKVIKKPAETALGGVAKFNAIDCGPI